MVKANAGQKNQKGINAQNWAAMSLFLQFHRDKSFSYIQLEPNDSEDFDLYFTNGKRIICESKYKNRQLTYADLKKVLNKISSKKSVSNQDEILLICKKVSDDLLDKV